MDFAELLETAKEDPTYRFPGSWEEFCEIYEKQSPDKRRVVIADPEWVFIMFFALKNQMTPAEVLKMLVLQSQEMLVEGKYPNSGSTTGTGTSLPATRRKQRSLPDDDEKFTPQEW